MDKKQSRIRRSRRARAKIASLGVNRLSVHRTPRHTYAQVFSGETGKVIAAASTLSADIKKAVKYPGNVEASVSPPDDLSTSPASTHRRTPWFSATGST